MKKFLTADDITYHWEGDFLVPDIVSGDDEDGFGKWGMKRLKYLEEIVPAAVQFMRHIEDVEQKEAEAEEMEKILRDKMMKKYGLTEQLFAENQPEYRKLEHTMELEIENIIMEEIICTPFDYAGC